MAVEIPGRFSEVINWKGPVDADFLQALTSEYAKRIVELAKAQEAG